MNRSLSSLLLFLVLLTSCGGCKKEAEQTAEPTISKTPTCLVTTQTIKELAKPNQALLDPETVTIGGESFQVSTTQRSAYTYDTQGRIRTEYNQHADGKSDSVYYQYTSSAVNIYTVDLSVTPEIKRTQVVELNSQGFAPKQLYDNYATYDNDGYLTSFKNEYKAATVVNGNVTESLFVDSPATPSYITKSEYDLSKSGLPSIQTFYGKPSRNLLIRSVTDANNRFYIIPNVYTTVYEYLFNDKGQLTRQTTRGKDGENPYVYGGDLVRVINFTYVCP